MRHYSSSIIVTQICLVALAFQTSAQTVGERKSEARGTEKAASKTSDTQLLESQRRAFAISLVTSLADEARNFNDRALRSRVLARAADTLWNADRDTARTLFRKAWEAAEKGDAEELTLKNLEGVPPSAAEMVTALRRISGNDLRAEVLALAARHDQSLGEEFLNKLKQDTGGEKNDRTNTTGSQNSSDGSEAVSRRLNLASKLLDAGEIERALEFATPALIRVNANSIGFLSKLRQTNAAAADQRFSLLLTHAETDPSSDANTISGLSSYVFTPGFYVTFNKDGGARWTQPDSTTSTKTPDLPPPILNKFFSVAAVVLLRPLPPPDQDFTTSGPIGKYMVVKRLLSLFEQHAPETAVALRSQLQDLSTRSASGLNDESFLLKQGLNSGEPSGTTLQKLQERLDHAGSSLERDPLYADMAAMLARQGDGTAQDYAQKIEEANRRAQVRRYVDFELVRFALQEKKVAEARRRAASDQLTYTQRAWAYMETARLQMISNRQLGLELLEEAANQARHVEPEDANRARLLIGVAAQFFSVDRVRAWEIMDEVVKAANNSAKFNGENVELHFPLVTQSGLTITSVGGANLGLSNVLRSLTKDDLYRSIDLAKGFRNEAPRAVAMLAIANALLDNEKSMR